VKTHRQKLYAKLNLSTQQELFSTFLKSLSL
jgi:DNA-binding CsgD family transcriptional regulator